MKTGIVNSNGQSYRVMPSDKDRSNGSHPQNAKRHSKKKQTDGKASDAVHKRRPNKALIDEYI